MNHIFRLVWSQVRRAWVVTSELATRRGKAGRSVDERAAFAVVPGCGSVNGAPSARNWPLRLGVLVALMALYPPVHAADRWWDTNGTALGLGGTGIWNTTSAFWSPNDDGVSGPYSAWNNTALDDAFFSGTAGTVTLGGPITVHNLTFLGNGYTINGSTLTLADTAPVVNTGDGAVTQTINSIIAGSAGLTKAGTGTLRLTGANTFNGGVNLNAGVLSVSGDAALGDGSNVVIAADGTELNSSAALAQSRTVSITGGQLRVSGAAGSAFFTGAGGVALSSGSALSNDANSYAGQTSFNGDNSFTSIGNLGETSSLGAPVDAAAGSVVFAGNNVSYLGDGDTSNRNWQLQFAGTSQKTFRNAGSGTLTIAGDIDSIFLPGQNGSVTFNAAGADLELLGTIGGNGLGVSYAGSAGRTITLGNANTYSGGTSISGVTVRAGVLADIGSASSFGTGATSIDIQDGVLSYVGAGGASNRTLRFFSNSSAFRNDGSGALVLNGNLVSSDADDIVSLGGSFTDAVNIVSGSIFGSLGGGLRSNGAGTWVLNGATSNYTGSTVVDSGTLRAGTANGFGATSAFIVNGGTLDMNGFDRTVATLSGNGGTVDLGSATLTLEAAAGVATYAGSIIGSGGLTKLGASSQTLTGANTYTGATTVGGGSLNLDFSAAGGPANDIISSASTLNMAGGRLTANGAAGEASTQTFAGLNITAGNNTIDANSGTGGSMTVNMGGITRTGGLVNFEVPVNGNITTTNTTLGGWASVNGADYAKVESGNITAFTEADYSKKDNAANWLDSEFISDVAGFFGTVSGSVQLGGLRYTAPAFTTVTVQSGETLGVDGTIIVAPSVAATNQTITGGFLTGATGGGSVGVLQNSTGNFTIAAQIIDNGGSQGFTKAGSGLATLSNAGNSYTGATAVTQGMLSVANIGNGGVASSIGASSAGSSNLLLEGATLRYTGGTTSSDRGFTIAKSGGIPGSGVEVTNAGTDLTFSGLVTSPDDARFTKSGAGTLTLANGANDYVGTTTVTGGLLSVNTLANGGQASGIGASSAASANLVLNNGGLQYTGATVSSDRGFTLAGIGTIDVSDAATVLTLSGTAAGTSRLVKTGAGTLVLSGLNTYSGNTINDGILRAGSTRAFGTDSFRNFVNLADSAGVLLDLANFDNSIGGLSGGGASGGNVNLGSATLNILAPFGNSTYAGAISGSGGISVSGSGGQTFTGCNNTYAGVTRLAGTLTIDCLANGGFASGIGASSNAPTSLALNNGRLNYTGDSVSVDRGFQVNGAGTVSVTNAATVLEFGGQVSGGGQLTKDGAGTLMLSGANPRGGSSTRVVAGTLQAGSTTALGGTGMILGDTAGVLLDLDGFNNTAGFLSGGGANGGNIELDAATLTLVFAPQSQLYGGAISGSGGLIKNGSFVQALTGCNSGYSGGTVVNAGVLQVNCLMNSGASSSIGASTSDPANLTLNGGTLRYAGAGDSTDRQFTLGTTGGTLDASGTGAINFSSTAAVTLAGTNVARTLTLSGTQAGDNVLSAQLTNNGTGATSLTKTGTGTWRLANSDSTYTGVTRISGGVLSIDHLSDGGLASSIGASSNAAANLVIGNGSTLRYSGAGDSTDRLFTLETGVTFIESSGTGAIVFSNTAPVTLVGTNAARTIALGGTSTDENTMGGAIGDNGTGATTLAKNDSGTWILTGDNTYTGNTVINGGNLVLGNGGTTGNLDAGNVIVDSATSTLSLNRSDTFSFNGILSGAGTLAQIGTGSSVLISEANQVGATTIGAGTLEVDGGLATSSIAMSGISALAVDGTVQAVGGGQTLVTGDAGNSTIDISTGGTLLANGNLGDGSDTLSLAGTLDTGAGTLNLGDSDDTLVLQDSAVITGGISGGGGGNDNLVIDNALARTFNGDGVSAFERLTKQNSAMLTTTGLQTFSAGTDLVGGILTVDVGGQVETSTVLMSDGTVLNVDGTVQALGGTAATITGSAGANTAAVGTGGVLRASGDLGDGNDVLDVAGTLDTMGGTFALGDGDDTLTIHENTTIVGTVSAGAGTDTFDTHIDTVANLGAVQGFETLSKTGTGDLNINGPMSSDFTAVAVREGAVNVTAAGIVAPTAGNTLATTVAGGATLRVDGSYGCGAGSDTMNVAGTVSGSGTVDLCDGADTLTLQDSAVLANAISGGVGADDTLVLDSAAALAFDAGNTADFELLRKDNSGTATLTGTQSFTGGASITGGALDVDGTLDTPTLVLADGTVLNVDGTVQALGGTAATITGSAGANTAAVGTGGVLRASGDLGDGNDVLDVAGTLDTMGGTFALGDGDDTLTIHENTTIVGTVSAGAGTDTFDTHIDTVANLGAVQGFETLSKTGTGDLNINGPMSSDFTAVAVREGAVNVTAAGIVAPTAGNTLATTVAGGATLRVDGSYGCGAGSDTMNVAGTVSGSGTVDLCDGADTLTLQDSAVLANAISGGVGADDTLVLDSAAALAFDAGNTADFELLRKDNSGTATLTGTQSFTGGASITGGALDVDGTLDTPTLVLADGTVLNVDGTVQALGGTAATITGSAGANTAAVGTGGVLRASGDLGDGNDVLDVAGTLETSGGVFALGAGSDTFTIHDGTVVLGTVDGGTGLDTFNPDIDTVADLGTLTNFEILSKTGMGVLNVNGPGQSDFVEVNVLEGALNIASIAGIRGVRGATVAGGAALSLDGDLLFTTGDDILTVAGTVTGSGMLDLSEGADTFTIRDGADLSGLAAPVSGGAGTDTLLADLVGSAVLGGAIDFETLTKTNVGSLHVDGPAMSAFTAVNVDGGALDIGVDGSISGVVTTTVARGGTLNVEGQYTGSSGEDTMAVSGTVSGSSTIAFLDGDDVLTLNDGADLSGFTGMLDGGAPSASDAVVLNNAGALTLDGANVVNFEHLQKDDVGEATLTGTHGFSEGTTVNGGILTVVGTLETPTVVLADGTVVNVTGTLQDSGGHATVTGSAGANTVAVSTGGALLASGDLGTGDDVLDVGGMLDTGGGVFALGDGDDIFVVRDGTVVIGTVDGGAGVDTRAYNINTSADLGALVNFEGVSKAGSGVLNFTGPGTTDLQEVRVHEGTLNISAGASVVATAGNTLDTVVDAGASLTVDGSFGCGAGNDMLSVSGTVSGSGTVDLCGGDDTLILNDGAVLAIVIDGSDPTASDTVILNNANALSFDGANVVNFEHLQKDNVGEATLAGTHGFSEGTTLNGGILTVAGTLETPTVALADGTVLNVDGTLQDSGGRAAITGSAGANTVAVSAGGALLASGDLGSGDDVLDVGGMLDTGDGVFALGAGDDKLTIHDGTLITGTVTAGEGIDTFNPDINTIADLGAVQEFETLSKTGMGVLNVNGPASSDFTTVHVLEGALNVTADGSVAAHTTTVAAGAILAVAGRYTGTTSDDSFTSLGTVRGAFTFGDGNDTVAFSGGDPSGVTSLDGGVGRDLLSFSGLDLAGEALPTLANWERVELLNNSALTLDVPLELSDGILAIDTTSQLFAHAGARIGGSVENAGRIDVGASRLAIRGAYSASDGALQVIVSPGTLSAGGLNIDGDVRGTTSIAFTGDGSDVAGASDASILVVSSPNDDAATAGTFVSDELIRLTGSPLPWSFGQQADQSWYLNADQASLLPEVPGYGVLPSLALLVGQTSDNLVHQRLAGVRGSERPQCGATHKWPVERAGTGIIDDCRGVWAASVASELELGANPGFEVSGDDVGLYVGVDGALDREGRTLRGGFYLGYRHGNYWTTGINSTELSATGAANVELDTAVGGMYLSHDWDSGSYLNLVLTGQVPHADVRAEGFSQRLTGNTLTLSSRVGRRYHLDDGWLVEPQLQLGVSAISWSDIVDNSGKELQFDDNLVGTARAAVRLEKAIVRSNGSIIRPWATLAVQDVEGEEDSGVGLGQAGSSAGLLAFPNHNLGTSVNLDVGVEATLNQRTSLFGVLSIGKELDGTDLEQREAYVGVRVRW